MRNLYHVPIEILVSTIPNAQRRKIEVVYVRSSQTIGRLLCRRHASYSLRSLLLDLAFITALLHPALLVSILSLQLTHLRMSESRAACRLDAIR